MAEPRFLAAVLAAALLVACGGRTVPAETGASPPTPPSRPAALVPAPGGPQERVEATARSDQPSKPDASRRLAATVTRVVDGDTVEVRLATGRTETARLIGVDTPETKHPDKPVEPYGPEAAAYTSNRLSGRRVDLELDVQERDRYGRILACVWLGDELFNATLVSEGRAQVLTIPPNVKYVDLFVRLQREAREAKRGRWGSDGSVPAPSPSAVPGGSAPPVQEVAPHAKGVRIVNLTSPVRRGGTATLTAQAWPGAACSIMVIYKFGPSRAAGLGRKTGGGDGRVAWSWKVGSQTTPGDWPVEVECEGERGGVSLVVQ